MKTLIILVDGMRPDAIADLPQVKRVLQKSAYTMNAQTVMPSVTLPCHMSLFHSVTPERHGTTTNTYAPQVRPINGICEVTRKYDKTSAFFFNWEEIRDLSRPNSLDFAYFFRGRTVGYDIANEKVTQAAIDYLSTTPTDFAFVYFGYTDMAGHRHGWMSDEYMAAMNASWDCIERILAALDDDYTVIITADHGGHDRTHGSDLPEDMVIPVIITGGGVEKNFVLGETLDDVNIIDLAPTVTTLLGIPADEDWDGKSII